MLNDLITATLIFKAKDPIAARQFLRYLTTQKAPADGTFASDYAKMIIVKAGALAHIDVREWLWSVIG